MRNLIISIFALLCMPRLSEAVPQVQDLDYYDALEEIENPHIGFYRPVGKHFTPTGNTASNTWGNLTHLRMDISEFSSNAVLGVNKETGDTTFGVSQPLTQNMLDSFEEMLDNVRKRGKSAIIKFHISCEIIVIIHNSGKVTRHHFGNCYLCIYNSSKKR